MSHGRLSALQVAVLTVSLMTLANDVALNPVHAAVADPVATDPAPQEVPALILASANGTGCPTGTTHAAWNAEHTAIEVSHTKYEVTVSETTLGMARQNCQVSLRIPLPVGYRYTIVEENYLVRAKLAAGAEGYVTGVWYVAGMSTYGKPFANLKGPSDQHHKFTRSPGPDQVVWSPCGQDRTVNVNTSLKLQRRQSTGSSTLVGIGRDSAVATELRVVWQRC